MSTVEFIAVNKLSNKQSSLSMVMRNTKAQYLKSADVEEDEQDVEDIEYSNDTKIKRKYPQRYKVSWEQNRTWLTQRNGQAYCRACSKQLVNNSSLLLRHENTKKHKRKESECGDLFNTNDNFEMVLRDGDPEYLEDEDDEEEHQKGTKASTPNKKKKKYPQKYRRAWEQDRSWLTEQDGLAYCRACNKQLGNNITRLIRHEQTSKHKRRKEQINFEVATVTIESIKSGQSRKSSPSEKISYYSADEQDDNESSEADNLLKPVITKVEVVKEDKAPIRKKKRDTIIPSSFRYKVDDAGEDEFDVIGKNVANKLRKLAPDTQMYAEKLVMDVIFQAQIGNIYKNSVLQIINCESQQPSSQPSSSVQSDCQISVNIASLPNSTPKNMTNFE